MADQPVDLNLEELKELIKLLRESNVSEFEIRKADYRLRIKHGFVTEETSALAPRATTQPGNGQPKLEIISDSTPEAAPAEAEKEELHEVRSPIVGTFYRSSTPGSASFVEEGDVVRKNQVLCIVEAMKIMNEIESDVDGEIRAIHVTNGQPIEFGELLFTIKPAKA
jgi:acetyl-CoA carboxylase biotin carboxyl carrier protein